MLWLFVDWLGTVLLRFLLNRFVANRYWIMTSHGLRHGLGFSFGLLFIKLDVVVASNVVMH